MIVGEKFPDKQDRALSTKCAMESQFQTKSAPATLVVLKYKTVRVYFKFIYSFTTSLSDPHIWLSKPKMERNSSG